MKKLTVTMTIISLLLSCSNNKSKIEMLEYLTFGKGKHYKYLVTYNDNKVIVDSAYIIRDTITIVKY